MAFSSAFRRAPWAAAAAARGLLASRSGWRIHSPQVQPHRSGCSALLSSLSAPQRGAAVDAQLLRVINYEISCAQLDCKKRDWAKLGEKFPFEIQDKEGTNRITLTRKDQKERIEIEVFLPSPAGCVEQNGEQEERAEDDQSQASIAAATQYYIPLVVKIHKGAASWLEISCRSYPDELAIESLAFGSRDGSIGSSDVEAKISNLPEEFHQAFHSYLKSRAISSDVTNFLHAYMINKDCHEYLAWLRKLKGLIKS